MSRISFKNNEIFYRDKKIGYYRRAFEDRYIPEFIEEWDFIYYQFDFHEGQNGDEDFFKNKVIECIQKIERLFT